MRVEGGSEGVGPSMCSYHAYASTYATSSVDGYPIIPSLHFFENIYHGHHSQTRTCPENVVNDMATLPKVALEAVIGALELWCLCYDDLLSIAYYA